MSFRHDANRERFSYPDEDLDNSGLFIVVYAGAIRRINNLGISLDAAKLVSNPRIRFVIFGAGDELEPLQNRVVDEGITNVF